ncbi:MAG: hydrogenase expression/formation protein HypE [bacterium]
MNQPPENSTVCPRSVREYSKIVLAHGGGGALTHELIEGIFAPAFDNPILRQMGDSSVFEINKTRLAFTTDSFVVKPIFFPGGDIGELAVYGTVNDLAMAGARPLYLSAGFILEEGFPIEDLRRIVRSMGEAAAASGVSLVTGDTKVVERSSGDGIYINTSGIGVLEHEMAISPQNVQEGDAIILSGDIGRHGIAVMAEREGLSFETTIESDCAPLAGLVLELLGAGVDVHCLRDLTRGGLATALVEIADAGHVNMQVEEGRIPVGKEIQGACEILGFDPLYVANEGRFVAFIKSGHTEKALTILKGNPLSRNASIIGKVTAPEEGQVFMNTLIGTARVLNMLSGEQMPRIC